MMLKFADEQAVGFCGHFGLSAESKAGLLWRELVCAAVGDILDGGKVSGAAYRAINRKAEGRTNNRMYYFGVLQHWLKPVLYSPEPNVKWLMMRQFWGLDGCKPTAFGVLQAVVETIMDMGRETGRC